MDNKGKVNRNYCKYLLTKVFNTWLHFGTYKYLKRCDYCIISFLVQKGVKKIHSYLTKGFDDLITCEGCKHIL